MVTSYHSVRWSLGGTPNSHRVEGGRDPVNPIYRHVWRRARAGLGWAGLGAFMNMNYSQSVPLTATNFLRQQEQSSWHGIVPASSHVSLHPHTSHQHVSRVAIITTLTARVHVLNCTYLRLKARVAFIITRVTVIISHQSSHWLYISRATHVYTVDICGRRNWKPISNLIGARRNVAEYKTRTFYCLLISLAPL